MMYLLSGTSPTLGYCGDCKVVQQVDNDDAPCIVCDHNAAVRKMLDRHLETMQRMVGAINTLKSLANERTMRFP